MSQLDLFKNRTGSPEETLTQRQRFALAFVKASGGPVQGDELGATLHEYRMQEGGRGHRADTRCRFCPDEGKDMAAALMRKGLVKRSSSGGFCAAEYSEPVIGHDPRTAEIPF